MKSTIKLTLFLILTGAIVYSFTLYSGGPAVRAGCEAYIYIANNSTFECRVQVDGIPQTGSMLPSKVRTFPVELLNDAAKRVKVKIIYDDPDYLEPKSYVMVTKSLSCGQTDSLYIAHTK